MAIALADDGSVAFAGITGDSLENSFDSLVVVREGDTGAERWSWQQVGETVRLTSRQTIHI